MFPLFDVLVSLINKEGKYFYFICRNYIYRRLNKRSERIGYRLMRPWRMPLVISTGLGQIHKGKIKSLSFNKSIGISLPIHSVFFIFIKKR